MPRLLRCLLLALAACQPQGGSDDGLIVVSDTAQVGPPPACIATPTTGDDDTSDGDGTTASTTGDAALDMSPRTDPAAPTNLSSRTGASAAPDPGTAFCAQFTGQTKCDGALRMAGDTIIGECRWVRVVPVIAGTCEATLLYDTCVHVPVDGGPCEAAQSCGQIGLGVFGREGCDGTIEILVVPPGQALCASPTDWPLCWPLDDDDIAPECTCICS